MTSNSGTTADDAVKMVEMASTAQKANNVVNQVSSAIPKEAKDFMKSAKEKVFDSDKLRSVSVFFGFGDKTPYDFVLAPSKLLNRLKNNTVFFYLNYILLTAVVLALTLFATLMTPKTLIILGILGVVWFSVLKATTSEGFKVLGITFTRKEVSAIMMILTGAVAFYFFESIFFVSICSSFVLALAHAWTRNAEEHLTAENNKQKPLEPDAEFQ